MSSKIVFVHDGRKPHLPYVLQQARSASPNSDVVLIGGGYEGRGIRVIPLGDLSNEGAETFLRVYQHMSPNPPDYERFCYLRYFYMLEYMRRENIGLIWSLDSDVLLYSSVSELERTYPEPLSSCGILIPEQDMSAPYGWACGHVACWTVEWLEDFCDFIISNFTLEKYQVLNRAWWAMNDEGGGVSDMITLWMFRRERGEGVVNLAPERDGAVIDYCINFSFSYRDGEFECHEGRKRVFWIKRRPFFRRTNGLGGLVRVHAIHFQGAAKAGIPGAYSGHRFPGKTRLDLSRALNAVKNRTRPLVKKFF